MNKQKTTPYTARVRTTGGRGGRSRSSDGRLDIQLSRPGVPGNGTNPEQLFAAGWSACFGSAIEHVARDLRIRLPADPTIDAEIDLNHDEGGYFLSARLAVSLPGLEHDTAQRLIEAAHQTCPYSKVTRGNIEVTTGLSELKPGS